MTVMDLLGVVGNGKIHITEATYNMPRLFYGDRKDIPPTLNSSLYESEEYCTRYVIQQFCTLYYN